jgi:hypothetical protein
MQPVSPDAPFRPPIGVSDFRKLREERATYVDKTRLIVDLLAAPAKALLFPRPRRFCKTLALSSLRYFLERSDDDRTHLFKGLEVWADANARAHGKRVYVRPA